MGAQNLVINGSFEEHDLPYCGLIAPPDSSYLDSLCFTSIFPNIIPEWDCFDGFRAFGQGTGNNSGNFSWFFNDCYLYGDTTEIGEPTYIAYGEAPPNGQHYIGIGTKNNQFDSNENGINFDLSSELVFGNWYKLSYYTSIAPTPPDNYTQHGENTVVEFGLSNDSMSFGMQQIHTSPLPDSNWQKQTVVFQANENYDYLSLKTSIIDTGFHGILVDHVVLSADTTTTNVQELQKPKQLLRIVDVLGRESKPQPNIPLFYIYTDGTVEKRIVIE